MISIYRIPGIHSSVNCFHPVDIRRFSDIANYITKYTWSPIIYRNNLRQAEFFAASRIIALDFDNTEKQVMTLSQAVDNVFCDMCHIIGTTRNHQKPKTSGQKVFPPADRFRVILMLESTIKDMRTFKWNFDGAVRHYESDPNARGASRLFYPCVDIVSVGDGYLLEVDQPPTQFMDTSAKDVELAAFGKIGKIPLWLQHNLDRSIAPGNRNNAVFGMAMDLAKIQTSRNFVIEKLMQSRVYIENADDREFVRGMESTINSIFRKGRR